MNNAGFRMSAAVLISGSGSNLQAIIDAIEQEELNARVLAVISNRPDAYGLERSRRTGFVDKMIELAVHAARQEAIDHSVTAETTSGVADDGFPYLWAITWRTGSASWMLRNRGLLERALA